jgi:hypothetical protein
MRAAVRYVVATALFVATSPLMAQAPKPGPEVKKLEAWVGTWAYEGDAKATPMGPATKISGTQTSRMVLNGFGLEWKGEEKGLFGAIQWSETDVYDSAAKTYPFFGVQNDGVTWTGTNTIVGNVWKSTGTQTVKGVTYKTRAESTPSADGKSWTQKFELSTDGKTWMPFMDLKLTKSAAPKS